MNAKLHFHFVFLFLLIVSIAFASDRMPFRMVGNLILIEATVNNQTGEFILDTGAPDLILNVAYFDGVKTPWAPVGVFDFQGRVSPARYLKVNEFKLGSIELAKQTAFVTDLSSIENVKHISIMGIIGYEVLKNIEILFDFDYQELEVVYVKNRRSKGVQLMEQPQAEFDLKLSGHIPYIVMRIGKRNLRMGIDSGAEVNILHKAANGKTKIDVVKAKTVFVKSISDKKRQVESGIVGRAAIKSYSTGGFQVALMNMQPLNNSLPIDLDGFLGIPFFKKGKMSINYKKRKLCIWPSEGVLANEEVQEDQGQLMLEE